MSIIGDGGSVSLDGDIDIARGTHDCDGHVIEDIICIGTTGHAGASPTLRVGSGIVRARHSARIERITPERVFPLRMRGVEYRDAVGILLAALARRTIAGIETADIDPDAVWRDACARVMRTVEPAL